MLLAKLNIRVFYAQLHSCSQVSLLLPHISQLFLSTTQSSKLHNCHSFKNNLRLVAHQMVFRECKRNLGNRIKGHMALHQVCHD